MQRPLVQAIALGDRLPECNATAAHRDEIAALHAYSQRSLDSVPEPARVLITAHDAFAYFGRAYGWQVEGIQGISTESEAGLARIGELVDLQVAQRIPVRIAITKAAPGIRMGMSTTTTIDTADKTDHAERVPAGWNGKPASSGKQ